MFRVLALENPNTQAVVHYDEQDLQSQDPSEYHILSELVKQRGLGGLEPYRQEAEDAHQEAEVELVLELQGLIPVGVVLPKIHPVAIEQVSELLAEILKSLLVLKSCDISLWVPRMEGVNCLIQEQYADKIDTESGSHYFQQVTFEDENCVVHGSQHILVLRTEYMPFHHRVLCGPSHAAQRKYRYEEAKQVQYLDLGTEVVQTQNKVDEEDQEQIKVGEEGQDHGLLNTFSESAGLSEDAKEAINVSASLKDKRASQRVDSC